MTQTNSAPVVCATDFSAEAASALSWAAAFARREGAQLHLVHVAPYPSRDIEALATDVVTFETIRLLQAREDLAIQASAPDLAGLVVGVHLLAGEAHVRIADHAREHGARLVALGACGRSTLESWIVGSVAERTIRRASCPVVVVPRAEPAWSWFPGRGLRVLVALEGDEDRALVTFAADLRRPAPCDATFLHLYWPLEEYARLGLRGARNLLEPDPDVARDLEPKLRERIGVLPGTGQVSIQIQPAWGEPAANIALAVEQQTVDLLVVGAHRRHGLSQVLSRSTAERLARQAARIPIACVPAVPAPQAPSEKAAAVPRLSTVLAPTDLSPFANGAIPHAYALLRGTGGVVELVYVREHGLPSPAYVYEQPDPITPAARADIERQLRALVPAEAEGLGISTHVSIVDGGKAAEGIVQAAERLRADAISIGSHGRGGIGRAILGSVADEVVRRAHRPVLVVR